MFLLLINAIYNTFSLLYKDYVKVHGTHISYFMIFKPSGLVKNSTIAFKSCMEIRFFLCTRETHKIKCEISPNF